MGDTGTVLESARRKLAALAPLAQRLNDAANSFTAELRIIEAGLSKLNLGISATLQTVLDSRDLSEAEPGEPSELQENSYLGFGRFGQDWKLLVRVFREVREPVSWRVIESHLINEMPLLTASRSLRLAAAEQIEDLLNVIEADAKKKLVPLEKSVHATSMPTGWERVHVGVDEYGLAHVLSPAAEDALCGARIVATNFEHEGRRWCSTCEGLSTESNPQDSIAQLAWYSAGQALMCVIEGEPLPGEAGFVRGADDASVDLQSCIDIAGVVALRLAGVKISADIRRTKMLDHKKLLRALGKDDREVDRILKFKDSVAQKQLKEHWIGLTALAQLFLENPEPPAELIRKTLSVSVARGSR